MIVVFGVAAAWSLVALFAVAICKAASRGDASAELMHAALAEQRRAIPAHRAPTPSPLPRMLRGA